jgi:GR25 family glycosyltransferase involved in LPS biosynthesis
MKSDKRYNLSWIDKIFVINLDRSKERLKNCLEQSTKYNFKLERFSAVDGSKLKDEEIKDVHPICRNFLCTNSMIGCGLSHYYLLKKIVDENIQTALILEDDFIWRDDTISKINTLQKFDKGIVKLNCIGPFCKNGNDTSNQPQLSPFPLGNAAYLVRRKDAETMLSKIKQVIYYMDFQYSVVSKLNSMDIYYYDCLDVDGMNDSTIGVHKSTFFNDVIPVSSTTKWFLNEPFMAPFGKGIHLFLFLSFILIITGLILFFKSSNYKSLGLLVFGIGLIDLLYYSN